MKSYSVLLFLLFAGSVWCCSMVPFVPFYSVTERTILSPMVVHGRVVNTSSSPDQWQQYDACIQVLEVIKGDKNLPRLMCFGNFGAEHLCLTNVYRGSEYVFYMTADKKANYHDGEPKHSAVVATSQSIAQAKQGVCDPLKSPTCQSPVISKTNFQPIIRVQEGQTAELSCFASGSKPMVLKWSKRGDYLSHDIPHTYNRLRIPSVTMSDMAVYQCTFQNAGGITSALVRLFINPIPCGGFLYLRPGQDQEIKSPNYPRTYGHDKMCTWRICPLPGLRVKLDFKHFDIGRTTSDDLQITQECEPVHSARRYCTDTSPGRFISKCTSRCIQVWFRAGRSSMNSRLIPNEPYGVMATVSATTDAPSMFDYQKLYCDNDILIKLIPKDTTLLLTIVGRVIDSYKDFTSGQSITIKSTSFNDYNIFGCPISVEQNQQYYVGLRRSTRYELNFIHPVDGANKPAKLEENLIKFKTSPPSCKTQKHGSAVPTRTPGRT